MASLSPTAAALCARFAAYDSVVEIGIGNRVAVASALAARGVAVTATDVRPRDVPAPVRFVRDDAFDPDPDVYRGTDAIYALNAPPELHNPIRAIARAIDVPFLFTTLGADPPAIPVATETIPGDTLFRATERVAGSDRRRRSAASAGRQRRSSSSVSPPCPHPRSNAPGEGEG